MPAAQFQLRNVAAVVIVAVVMVAMFGAVEGNPIGVLPPKDNKAICYLQAGLSDVVIGNVGRLFYHAALIFHNSNSGDDFNRVKMTETKFVEEFLTAHRAWSTTRNPVHFSD